MRARFVKVTDRILGTGKRWRNLLASHPNREGQMNVLRPKEGIVWENFKNGEGDVRPRSLRNAD